MEKMTLEQILALPHPKYRFKFNDCKKRDGAGELNLCLLVEGKYTGIPWTKLSVAQTWNRRQFYLGFVPLVGDGKSNAKKVSKDNMKILLDKLGVQPDGSTIQELRQGIITYAENCNLCNAVLKKRLAEKQAKADKIRWSNGSPESNLRIEVGSKVKTHFKDFNPDNNQPRVSVTLRTGTVIKVLIAGDEKSVTVWIKTQSGFLERKMVHNKNHLVRLDKYRWIEGVVLHSDENTNSHTDKAFFVTGEDQAEMTIFNQCKGATQCRQKRILQAEEYIEKCKYVKLHADGCSLAVTQLAHPDKCAEGDAFFEKEATARAEWYKQEQQKHPELVEEVMKLVLARQNCDDNSNYLKVTEYILTLLQRYSHLVTICFFF
jgi:hypothetical protein